METLHTAEAAGNRFMDDLLDFASDIGEEDDDEMDRRPGGKPLPSRAPASFNVFEPHHLKSSLPEFVEEELEWISNKDAFPALETFVGILSDHPGSLPDNHSPFSVLDNSVTSSTSTSTTSNSANSTTAGGCSSIITSYCGSLRVPVKARSKRHRRRRHNLLQGQQNWWGKENQKSSKPGVRVSTMGRKCQHCGVEKTPQWRAGPLGPKTLCNACGVRYKSGRLVPEYRPASSPTFCNELHSNSHRKVLEMRKQKQMTGLMVVKPMDKG
ncbi:hypothetical protein K2173_003730 [Erythroxylum novogranatense]|uniref:GATA-type domain-containing protein n=1 Tax=Erythroxylum novogranatense TaxID=1862640 RepID=A0AAV8TBE0_9ROSI|nr:hypothetical protein K2173_003730 [Erythroxylum novogranatense]